MHKEDKGLYVYTRKRKLLFYMNIIMMIVLFLFIYFVNKLFCFLFVCDLVYNLFIFMWCVHLSPRKKVSYLIICLSIYIDDKSNLTIIS